MPKKKEFDKKRCKRVECGDEYTPIREHQLYCSTYCRQLGWLENKEITKFEKPSFAAQVGNWIATCKTSHPTFQEIRKAVYRRVQRAKKRRKT